ncbi:MAG: M48 family metallopeptidase [Bacteroidales bacterium]|nr:M48 family metallopeptidase [Bacteroidales bacterium]MCB9000296.1 M48 family metallopeptidase [Bacteroidales bacterium]
MLEKERVIFFDGLGDISFKKSRRARRLSIRIRSFNDVRVSIPYYSSFRQAEAFVSSKSTWIQKTQALLLEKAGAVTIFNELTEFSTLRHDLKIERIDGNILKRKIADGKILVSVPFTQEVSSKTVQSKIRTAILEAWRKEAKEILPERIAALALQHGFKFSGLSVKNMKTRWGSCTGKNSINLNLHLVRLPDHLRDYVILHELVHTVHKNHGKYFWSSLDKLCGNAKALARELKNYRLDIW